MISQRQLYQIGDVVLHGHNRSGQSQSYAARGQSVELVDTYKMLSSVSAHKTTIRSDTADILLFSNGVFSASQIAELLKRQIGVFTDVIAYVYTTREQAMAQDCGCLLCGCCPCNIMWLHNVGVLKSITIAPVDYNTYSAQLTFELHSYWKPLSPLLWSYRGLGVSRNFAEKNFNINTYPLMNYPTCANFFTGCIQFYRQHYKNIEDFIYNADLQSEILCNESLPSGYPFIGYTRTWGTFASTHVIHAHAEYWSAPPMSIYTFRKFVNDTSQATILISREEANRSIESRTTINFARVNNLADDNGVTLIASDELRVGDVDGFAHVMRDGEIILYCAEVINRTDGDFPGYLTPGTNRVAIDPKGTEFWHYHLFRSL